MVPIGHDNGVLGIVLMHFWFVVDNKRRPQSIDVLRLSGRGKKISASFLFDRIQQSRKLTPT